MYRDDAGDALGSAADEAVRLVAALRDLATGPGAEHLATGASECQVCPFCRLVTLLREADPQTVGRAADGVVSMVSAAAALAEPFLRSMVDTAVTAAQAAAGSTAPRPSAAPSSDAAPSTDDDLSGDEPRNDE